VHHDVDAVVLDVEEQVRLDHLESLVHERRRVRRDDEAHVPRRMGERLGRRDVGELGAGPAAERAAGGGEHEPAHLVVGSRPQGLRDRGVLGVDGHDLPRLRESGHEVAADDERLLIREGERRAALEGRDRGGEPHRPRDAVQHHVGVHVAHELHGLVDADRGVLDVELRGLRLEQCPIRADRESDDIESARVRPDDLESLGADRA
jgi:hypothetical protein